MRYALVENGVVVNVIWLNDKNAGDFPAAVKLGDRPATMGDTYTDGKFYYRDGTAVLTALEQAQAEIDSYKSALNEMGVETEESSNEN